MSKYICKICGKEFDRVGNGVYCLGPHYRPCPICGKPVEFHRPSEPIRCCSKECRSKMIEQTKSAHDVRYCEICGKPFIPKQANQKYCSGPHITNCVVCGKPIEYSCYPGDKPNTCSVECGNALRKQTVTDRYGVANVAELEAVRQKISNANVNTGSGGSKRIATCMTKWGVDNPSKSAEVIDKITTIMNDPDFIEKRKQTCLDRYGVDSPSKLETVQEKRKQTNMERYGTFGHRHTREQLQREMSNPDKVDELLAFKQDPQRYISDHYDVLPTAKQLSYDIGITDDAVYYIMSNLNCSDLLSVRYSSMETEVTQFIKDICPDIKLIHNSKQVIYPYEVDIYLPDYKLAIECNPTITHNSSFTGPWGSEPKPYRYHQIKSELAEKSGVFLFHIFGYEWKHKQDIIKSMLRNLLGKNKYKYGARETYIDMLSANECRDFLNENHRQGTLVAKIRLGLRLKSDNTLVSVMTFGKLRKTLGTNSAADTWELSRFCNKLNTTVTGSASKLFNYFIKQYNPSQVISFSDVAHTRGSLYKLLGFKFDHVTEPNYIWAHFRDIKFYSRVACQKRKLPKLFDEPDLDIQHHTEREIMENHGFAQVFDSGVIKWVHSI